nr:O-antigen ligase family protein [Leptolyngbya sp. 7M]
MLCNYLTVALGMAFILFRANPRSPYLILAVLLINLAAIFTLTPGLGGFILSLCVLLYCTKIPNSLPRSSLIFVYLGLFIAISSVLISAYPPWDISSAIVNSDGSRTFYSLGPRALTWYDSFRTFLEYPFTGKGLGLGVASVYYQSASGRGAILTDAHNTWLNVAAQAGLLGLIAIIWLTVHFASKSVRLIRDKNPFSPLAAVFIGAFLAQGFIGSFENARHLWVLLGVLTAAGQLDRYGSNTGSGSE